MNAGNVTRLAKSIGITPGTPGFRRFARRAVGETNVASMNPETRARLVSALRRRSRGKVTSHLRISRKQTPKVVRGHTRTPRGITKTASSLPMPYLQKAADYLSKN